MKKKVTLSLDEDVVKEAKNRGLNMSKAANTALKERTLLSNLSEGERTARRIINDARDHENAAVLPMRIKKLKLENIGKFEDKKVGFNGRSVAIYGPNGSGKTTVFRALKAFFGDVEEDIINFNSEKGSIEVEVKENKGKIDPSQSQPIKGQCLIIDSVFQRLSEEKAEEVIEELETKYSEQIIITTTRPEIAEKFDDQIKLSSINEERLQDLEDEIEEKEDNLENIKTELRKLQDEKDELQMKYDEILEEKSSLEAKEERLEEIKTQKSQLEKDLGSKEEKLESIEDRIEEEEDEREIGKLEERAANTRDNISEIEDKLNELEEKQENLEDGIEEQEDLAAEKNKINQKIERINGKIAEKRSTIEDLREDLSKLESKKDEVKDKL